MAKLIIKLNNEVVDHVDLRQGDMKIGRKPGCEIVLDNLAVSGEHANIFTIGDDSFIQDLNSTNGTFINNKRVAKHHLRNGDTINIGQHSLLYLTESSRAAAESTNEYAKTVVISPTPPAAAPAPAPTAAAERTILPDTGADLPPAALFILNGKGSGKRIEITKAVTNLGKTGRSSGTIVRTADGFFLRATDDVEKPKLNGRAVSEGGAKLRNGDIIEVAGTRLQFYLK
ncbi:MAG: FHA domain-containing protein [Sulfurifustaceae bacterium]